MKWTMKPLKFSRGHWVRRLVRLWVSRVTASSLVWYPAQHSNTRLYLYSLTKLGHDGLCEETHAGASGRVEVVARTAGSLCSCPQSIFCSETSHSIDLASGPLSYLRIN